MTKSELSVLKSAIEGGKRLTTFNEAMPAVENGGEVKSYFSRYLKALNGRYFNQDLNVGSTQGPGVPLIDPIVHVEGSRIPLIGPILDPHAFEKARYRNQSENFQSKMGHWVDAKLAWMLKNKETKTSDLETFKTEIAARYEMYSKMDGNASIISAADLTKLEAIAKPNADVMGRMLEESNDETIKRLEVMQLLNPNGWSDAIDMAGNAIVLAAVSSAAEQQFVTEMNKYKPVKDFSGAKKEFRKMLKELSEVGVRETLGFLKAFNLGVHGDVLQYEEAVDPPSLKFQVHKQLDYLLGGVLVPQKETDRMLVRFMTSGRKERGEMMASDGTREVLFRAIKQATEQYPEVYRKQFPNIPDEAGKLRRSTHIESPTFHDRAAQMQALIILGNQAKVIVSQLQMAPEHRGKDYVSEIDRANVPEDPKVVLTGLRFRAPGSGTAPYRSALDRGGFNTRDLALKGAKVLGLLVVVSNVAQSFSETHGDFVDRVFDTVEKAATNQGVLIGAGVTVGAHLAERDKAFLRYPWLSQHERAGTMVAFKLDNLAARVGQDEMSRFLNNNAEWRALTDPAMDPAQIKEMLSESNKRTASGSHPTITVEDLRKVIKDESIVATLTTGGKSARMRYLFYEKFFSSATKPDVNHMRELCTGSSHISSSPSKTKK